MNKFYLTTPIYYVNGEAHIGHAYTTIIADVIKRFHSLDGVETFFLTGTDEHGQKVHQSAAAKGIETQDFVDNIVLKFQNLWDKIYCQYDYFIRTTDKHHKAFVQDIWNKMIQKGYIYLGSYSGWYAVRDEAFYSEAELVNGKAPTGADVEWLEEPSYFFKLSAFQEKLLKFYEDNPSFVMPNYRFNEVKAFVKGGLRDLSVSRIAVKWGISVPNDEKHIIYVWLDALFNYLSALYANDKENFWPCNLHIVGKDILQFHAVYWPAFLMALDIAPPNQILAHGWWQNNGEKMSKSLGNVLDPNDIVDEFGRDYMRYFLLREMSIGQDGSFSSEALIQRINGELVNNIGNLVQRVTSFAYKQLGSRVEIATDLNNEDNELLNTAYNCINRIRDLMKEYKINDAIGVILDIGHKANSYIERNAPWKLKNDAPDRMKVVLYVLLEVIRVIGILLQPFAPDSAERILGTIYANPKKIKLIKINERNTLIINPVESLLKKL